VPSGNQHGGVGHVNVLRGGTFWRAPTFSNIFIANDLDTGTETNKMDIQQALANPHGNTIASQTSKRKRFIPLGSLATRIM